MYAFPTGDFGIPGYRISKIQLTSGSYPGSQQTKGLCFLASALLFGDVRIAGLGARIPPTE
jgi:hypothetical protein